MIRTINQVIRPGGVHTAGYSALDKKYVSSPSLKTTYTRIQGLIIDHVPFMSFAGVIVSYKHFDGLKYKVSPVNVSNFSMPLIVITYLGTGSACQSQEA